MPHSPDLLAELSWRGLVAQQSERLAERLARGPISAYIGFDASASSLHVGHLLQVFLLTHLQRAGGRPVVVIGGATGMIGDPSGKSSERNLLDDATIAANTAALREQLGRFLDFSEGPTAPFMVDNRDWLAGYPLLDFLRDVGKHFSVPYMLAKDSVQLRLAAGLSFTEFSYMTLQATDFLHLHRTFGVDAQLGGADQWGNITAGLELIRRAEGREEGAEPPAYGLCSPLLLTRSGGKMGKSEKGAVYLDPRLTTPFDFFQYWLNDDDALVAQHLRWLTLLSREEIEALERETAEHPEQRPGQRALAYDLTARIHGTDEADRQRIVAAAAFADASPTDPDVLAVLYDNLDSFEFSDADVGAGALDLAVSAGAYRSRGEARRAIGQGGLTINGQRITAPDAAAPSPIADRYLVVRTGKRTLRIGRRRG